MNEINPRIAWGKDENETLFESVSKKCSIDLYTS